MNLDHHLLEQSTWASCKTHNHLELLIMERVTQVIKFKGNLISLFDQRLGARCFEMSCGRMSTRPGRSQGLYEETSSSEI